MTKRRTSATSVESQNLVGEVDGKDVLMVDDLTETAGTLTSAAKLLKERGAKRIFAAVSRTACSPTSRPNGCKNRPSTN